MTTWAAARCVCGRAGAHDTVQRSERLPVFALLCARRAVSKALRSVVWCCLCRAVLSLSCGAVCVVWCCLCRVVLSPKLFGQSCGTVSVVRCCLRSSSVSGRLSSFCNVTLSSSLDRFWGGVLQSEATLQTPIWPQLGRNYHALKAVCDRFGRCARRFERDPAADDGCCLLDRAQNSPKSSNVIEITISLKLCEIDSLDVLDVLRAAPLV